MIEVLAAATLVGCIAVALIWRHFFGPGDPSRFGYGSSTDLSCDGDGDGDGGGGDGGD
jgi:hypothetical protein